MNYKVFTIVSVLLFVLYTVLDNYGYQNYTMLYQAYGWITTTLTILLNITISLISGVTVSMSYNSAVKSTKNSSYSLTTIANAIGALFAGCTSCGLNLLAAVGIGFVMPVVTPGAIEFKLLALGIQVIAYFIINYRIKHTVCEVKQ